MALSWPFLLGPSYLALVASSSLVVAGSLAAITALPCSVVVYVVVYVVAGAVLWVTVSSEPGQTRGRRGAGVRLCPGLLPNAALVISLHSH